MADSWLLWLAGAVGIAFAALLTLAGFALMGVFLAATIWVAARKAAHPAARAEVDGRLRRVCSRLPICDCRPPSS